MNDFYDIADNQEAKPKRFQLDSLGEQKVWASFGKMTRDGYGGREFETKKVYSKVVPEDYDKQFAYKLIRTHPPYEIEQLLEHHLSFYATRFPEKKDIFIKHIRYVILPLIAEYKNDAYIDLMNEWLNQNDTTTIKPIAMSTNQKLNIIVKFLVDHPERNNIYPPNIRDTIFNNSISLNEAQELHQKILNSGVTRVLGNKYLQCSLDTRDFYENGGFGNEMSNNRSIMNVDNMPVTQTNIATRPGAIHVFISYSWDSKDHQDKVSSFNDHLRKNGFDAQIDKMLSQAETAIHFVQMMHKSMRSADKVIIVLSPGYKQKAESFTGGVGEEYRLVLTDIQKNPKKYILVSFGGRSDMITPMGFQSRDIIDLSGAGEENRLFAKLRDKAIFEFSEVGSQLPEITVQRPLPFNPAHAVSTKAASAEMLLNLHNGMVLFYFHIIASRSYKMRMADAQRVTGFPVERRNEAFKLMYDHNLIESDGTLILATDLGKAVFKEYNLYQSDEIFDGNLQYAILKFFYVLDDQAKDDSLPSIFGERAPVTSGSYSKDYNLMHYIEYHTDLKGYIKKSNTHWYSITDSGKAKYLHEMKKRL